jgi:hypothetical protein
MSLRIPSSVMPNGRKEFWQPIDLELVRLKAVYQEMKELSTWTYTNLASGLAVFAM